MKRPIDIVVLSGIYLGSSHNQTTALQTYLDHIEAKTIVLNGNFIEPVNATDKATIQIVKTLAQMAEAGTAIYYIASNFPFAFQLCPSFYHPNVHLKNSLVLELGAKRYLFLNDNFSPQFFKNRIENQTTTFAQKALALAKAKNCQFIVCGHNCKPRMKVVQTQKGKITYMHPGDWHQYQTTLEFDWGRWSLYEFEEEDYRIDVYKNYIDEGNMIAAEMEMIF